MYEILAVLGGFALIYSAVAGGVERTWISGPIVFVALGVLLGPVGVGLQRLSIIASICTGSARRPGSQMISASGCSPGRNNRNCSWRWRS